MSSTTASRRDLHVEITDQLIAAIEADPGDPKLPWHRASSPMRLPINAQTNKAYSGVNVIALWCAGVRAGFTSTRWATYRQWSAHGCQVRKGEKGSPVVFYKQYAVDADPEDADDDGQRRVARLSIAFNANQVDGFVDPDRTACRPLGAISPPCVSRPAVDAFIEGTGATICHGGDDAYYDRRLDHIQLPPREAFVGTDTASPTESYYGVALHELGHWTGASHRLAREFGTRFGDDTYAMEELVAEIASAFLCAEHGISSSPRPDHAAYLGQWLKVMRSDSRAIFVAAAKASEAVRYLSGLAEGSNR